MASKESKPEDKNIPKSEIRDTNSEVSTSDAEKVIEEVIKTSNPMMSYWKSATIGGMVSFLFISILSLIVFDDNYYNINISGKMNVFQLSSYWHKLEFVLCHQIIGISWILLNMFYVISKRATNESINPMSGNEDMTLMARNIMQNSIEQFLMSSFAQIISISFIEANILIKIIPLINILFIVGRIAFFFGYPKYRTFGFMCSAIPNTLLINYNLYKFIQNLFF